MNEIPEQDRQLGRTSRIYIYMYMYIFMDMTSFPFQNKSAIASRFQPPSLARSNSAAMLHLICNIALLSHVWFPNSVVHTVQAMRGEVIVGFGPKEATDVEVVQDETSD